MLMVGEEVRPTYFVADRIDLLAIDQQGVAVVMELKRGSDKLQLLQGLAYGSMISDWDSERLISERAKFANLSAEEAQEEIEQFLREGIAELNESQRVVLIAEAFDYEVLVTAKWLAENYGVDIRCYRLVMAADNGGEFLSCTCIYPPPEITEHAIRRGRRTVVPQGWSSWEEALERVKNPAVVEFFRVAAAGGQESYLPSGDLYYRVGGKRRFTVGLRTRNAYVWQEGRFRSDEDFWKERLGEEANIQPVSGRLCLRFYLTSEDDFRQFQNAVSTELDAVEFLSADVLHEEEDA